MTCTWSWLSPVEYGGGGGPATGTWCALYAGGAEPCQPQEQPDAPGPATNGGVRKRTRRENSISSGQTRHLRTPLLTNSATLTHTAVELARRQTRCEARDPGDAGWAARRWRGLHGAVLGGPQAIDRVNDSDKQKPACWIGSKSKSFFPRAHASHAHGQTSNHSALTLDPILTVVSTCRGQASPAAHPVRICAWISRMTPKRIRRPGAPADPTHSSVLARREHRGSGPPGGWARRLGLRAHHPRHRSRQTLRGIIVTN